MTARGGGIVSKTTDAVQAGRKRGFFREMSAK